MKKINYIIILFLSLWACSEPEPDLQLSNTEAFAFDLGDSWEVNASVKAIGFAEEEKDDKYVVKLSYIVDLVTPNSDSLVSIFSNTVNESNEEEILDLILEAQIELDSSFSPGNYFLIFNVTDEYSSQTKSIKVKFDLTE